MTAIAELATAVVQWLTSEPMPHSRAAIRRAIARRGTDVRAAISMLLADPASGVVEVGPRIRGACRVWTRELAERAGLHVRAQPGADLAELADSVSAPPPPPSAPVDPLTRWYDWGGYDD
jgi:hypothetical protein